MKDPNLSELVRTCIRCWLYLVPQAFLGIHLFDMFMRRKKQHKASDDLAASAGILDRWHQRHHSAGILWR